MWLTVLRTRRHAAGFISLNCRARGLRSRRFFTSVGVRCSSRARLSYCVVKVFRSLHTGAFVARKGKRHSGAHAGRALDRDCPAGKPNQSLGSSQSDAHAMGRSGKERLEHARPDVLGHPGPAVGDDDSRFLTHLLTHDTDMAWAGQGLNAVFDHVDQGPPNLKQVAEEHVTRVHFSFDGHVGPDLRPVKGGKYQHLGVGNLPVCNIGAGQGRQILDDGIHLLQPSEQECQVAARPIVGVSAKSDAEKVDRVADQGKRLTHLIG